MVVNEFKPHLTPKKMLELGVFGGWYFGKNIDEYPKNWFKKAKLSQSQFNMDLNYFGVKAGLSRLEWKSNDAFQMLIEFRLIDGKHLVQDILVALKRIV